MKRFMPLRRFYALAALAGLASSILPLPARTQNVALTQYSGMQWRFVGPLRGGRTKAVAGVASQPNRFYIGAVNGGVWRTDDAGRTWVPIFDSQPTGSIGALAIAPSNPDI